MIRALAGVWLTVVGLAAQTPAEAPPWRLGVLFWHDSPNDRAALDGIRAALGIHGRPHELRVESANEDPAAAAVILEGFRSQPVDLVFAMGTQAALLCAEHLTTIPVVFTAVTNPVESGVVPDWTGSGRNLAGNSNWIPPDTVLRVFRLAVPHLARLGVLRSRESGVVSAAELSGMQQFLAAPGAPAVELVEAVVDDAAGLESATRDLIARRVDAIWVPIDFTVYSDMDRVLPTAAAAGVPLLSSSLRGTTTGAVAGILVDYELLGQRALVIAIDILEGVRAPAGIPIGTMAGFQVVVNLGAAKRCGYELPLSSLVVADVIHERLDPPAPPAENRDGRGR